MGGADTRGAGTFDLGHLTAAFREPSLRVVEEIAGIKLQASPKSGGGLEGPAIQIHVSGDLNGRVAMVFEETLSRYLVGRLLSRMGLEAGPEDLRPGLAELGNILLGHIDGKLSEMGLQGTFSAPTVGEVRPDPGEYSAPLVSLTLSSAEGAMEIDLYLKVGKGGGKSMGENRVRTLVVDDSVVMRRALRGILERHGYQVQGEAADGFEAIKLYKELQPDLVTLDIIMPRMSGIETLRLLKNLDPEARVVMVTAMTSQSKVLECVKFGAEHYIVKPFEEEKIVKVLEKVFPGGGERP